MTIRAIVAAFKQAGKSWVDDHVPRLSAALAYYTIFSLAPLLLIATVIVGLVFGQRAAQDEVYFHLRDIIGSQPADAVNAAIEDAYQSRSSLPALIMAGAAMAFGATAAFAEMQSALNKIWKVPPRPGRGVWRFIRRRVLTCLVVLAIGALLFMSMLASTGMALAREWTSRHVLRSPELWQGIDVAVSLALAAGLFALIFRILPDAEIPWRAVIVGAVLTAVLFTLGKYLIGWYLSRSRLATAYRAASSVLVLLLWTYYTALIFYFGAEFTKAYADQSPPRGDQPDLLK